VEEQSENPQYSAERLHKWWWIEGIKQANVLAGEFIGYYKESHHSYWPGKEYLVRLKL
jgi:hypothetical protein